MFLVTLRDRYDRELVLDFHRKPKAVELTLLEKCLLKLIEWTRRGK